MCLIAVSVDKSTSALVVKYAGVSDYFVCSEHWTSAHSHAVCRQLGYSLVFFSICLFFFQNANKTGIRPFAAIFG